MLATNVAETSLTVPGIRYVVDTGTARISRYSQRTKVQRLPIEPISQASARQRAGRCGRLADGVCIRLYSQRDYDQRPAYTEPEILRTNLASVILAMTTLGLGDVAAFPFVDPPDRRRIADGVALLEELQALANGELTASGRTIALLPVDPRLARMVIEADRLGCLREVLVVVAALSIQDPRERPARPSGTGRGGPPAVRRRALGLRRLPQPVGLPAQPSRTSCSGSAFRRMCKAEYLHYLRIREWQDLVTQLRQACRQGGFDVRGGAHHGVVDRDGYESVHRALLSGLLSQVGARDELRRDYLGARGARFGIAPGSVLFRRQPDFVMAGELVETSRLWARTVARIDPRWAEELGAHLVKRQYSEPRWSARRGSAVATESVTLYGVPLVTGRTVALGRVDPELARELFIRHALVEGDWSTRHGFFHDNVALLARLGELEARTRRRDLVVGDEEVFRFYDERLPQSVVSARHFDTWWRKAGRREPTLLTLTEDVLLRHDAVVAADDFPDEWVQDELHLPVTYQFEPGSASDGVTVHIGTDVLNQVRPDGFDWQVPGLREDLVAALLRTLPKSTRRLLVPAPEHAAATVRVLRERGLGPGDGPLTGILATRPAPDPRGRHRRRRLGRRTGARPPAHHLLRRGPGRSGRGQRHVARRPARAGRAAGAPRGGRGRGGRRTDRPAHLAAPGHGAARVCRDLRRAHGPRLPGARRRGRLGGLAGAALPRPKQRPSTGWGCAACSCSARRHRGGRCSPRSATPRSWPSATTRTVRCPPCWPMPWRARSMPSSSNASTRSRGPAPSSRPRWPPSGCTRPRASGRSCASSSRCWQRTCRWSAGSTR